MVFEGRSRLSGRVRVVEDRRERRLIVAGDILSVYPLDGDWARLRREYWWQALAAAALPPRPAALFVGLGGGTQLHLLGACARPRALAVIERDPLIVQVAERWFGLAALRDALEYLVGPAERVAPWLAATRRRFDLVVEDAAYAAPPARARALALALVPLVAPGGTLVANRHRRADARELARALHPRFARVRLRPVRHRGENVLVVATGPLRRS